MQKKERPLIHERVHTIKTKVQMGIGSFIFAGLFYDAFEPLLKYYRPGWTAGLAAQFPAIQKKPLEFVGLALAYSAGVELAYMLFTPGPDEALEPVILGLASAVLIFISKPDTITIEVASSIFVLCVAIGLLFYVRERFLPEREDESESIRKDEQASESLPE